MHCSVLGAGAWGSALACHLARRHSVTIWARRAEIVAEINDHASNEHYLPGQVLPSAVRATASLAQAVRAAGPDGLIVLATPVAGQPAAMEQLADLKASGLALAPVVGVAKGLDASSGQLPHQRAALLLPGHLFGVLSGPSFAKEVACGQPCALVTAGNDPRLAERVQQAFHHDAMRVYRSDDLVGVELAGAMKNVIALAAGIADGLGLGDNARAALVTRGLAEITRLGVVLGSHPATFMGLAGLGDLMLTCTGGLSRNRQVGLALASGQPVAQITASLGHVAEGVPCCAAALERAAIAGIEMPIAAAVQSVLDQQQSPADAVLSLLARDPAVEQH